MTKKTYDSYELYIAHSQEERKYGVTQVKQYPPKVLLSESFVT
jgi:hypothetical protein